MTPAELWLQAHPGQEAFVAANPDLDYGGMNQAAAERIGSWGANLSSGGTATPEEQRIAQEANAGLAARTGTTPFGTSGAPPEEGTWWSRALEQYMANPGAMQSNPRPPTVAPPPPPVSGETPEQRHAREVNRALAMRTGQPAFGPPPGTGLLAPPVPGTTVAPPMQQGGRQAVVQAALQQQLQGAR